MEFRLSAKTSIELLDKLSESQVDSEYRLLIALDESLTLKTRKSTDDQKRTVLLQSLSKTLCSETDKIVKNYQSFVEGITEVGNMLYAKSQGDTSSNQDVGQARPVAPVSGAPVVLCHPVRSLEASFAETQYADVLQSLDINTTHRNGRSTTYYGGLPYSYGTTVHPAAPYPDLPLFTDIATSIQQEVADFTLENYSCLVTHYKEGSVGIPSHQDNEDCIADDSEIITISLGARRTLRLRNVVGRIRDETLELTHGSVYAMSKKSQSQWQHGIAPDRNISDGRLSLTFRKMRPSAPKPSATPPSSAPSSGTPSPPTTPKRVLLLTDSILSGTPEYIFEAAEGHVCIKKTNYYLSELDGFAPEFPHTDIVIVSCGINDMLKRGLSGRVLADTASGMFKSYAARYPGTQFVFNSVLMTRRNAKLNDEVDCFNSIIFGLAENTRNLSFFDSDKCLYRSTLNSNDVFARDDNVHISFQARKLVTGQLVNAIGTLSGCKGTRFRRCDWLRCVTTRSSRSG